MTIEEIITMWCLIGIIASITAGHFIEHEIWNDYIDFYRDIKNWREKKNKKREK